MGRVINPTTEQSDKAFALKMQKTADMFWSVMSREKISLHVALGVCGVLLLKIKKAFEVKGKGDAWEQVVSNFGSRIGIKQLDPGGELETLRRINQDVREFYNPKNKMFDTWTQQEARHLFNRLLKHAEQYLETKGEA